MATLITNSLVLFLCMASLSGCATLSVMGDRISGKVTDKDRIENAPAIARLAVGEPPARPLNFFKGNQAFIESFAGDRICFSFASDWQNRDAKPLVNESSFVRTQDYRLYSSAFEQERLETDPVAATTSTILGIDSTAVGTESEEDINGNWVEHTVYGHTLTWNACFDSSTVTPESDYLWIEYGEDKEKPAWIFIWKFE